MKVVRDTNVLLSAQFGGICHTVVRTALRSHSVVLSEFILDEVRRHMVHKFKVLPHDIELFISTIHACAQIVIPASVPPEACRDPDDCMILGTALAAKADCLVTGDRDLLVLKAFEGIDILSPRTFHERVR